MPLCAITITGGGTVVQEAWDRRRVSKRDLVSTLQVLVQAGRLKIAEVFPEARTLVQETLALQLKIGPTTAHDSYGAWREGTHDDLLLAVALACWCGENTTEPRVFFIRWPLGLGAEED